ncbi:hypothetical protein EDC04DRAFT_2558830, partial [Pisolithus marmoratus]
KEVHAEFFVGTCLKHVHVIRMVNIICDHGHSYEVVMENAPYNLFAIVMPTKMLGTEVYCVFHQICSGMRVLDYVLKLLCALYPLCHCHMTDFLSQGA